MNGDAGALLLVCLAGPVVLAVIVLIWLEVRARRLAERNREARRDFEQYRREQRRAEREARKERKGPR